MRLAVCALVWAALGVGPAWGTLDSIVARVDREVVTWSEILQEREVLRATEAREPATLESVREDLIRRLLMSLEAERQLLRVDPREVADQVDGWAARGGPDFWPALGRFGVDRRWLETRSLRMLLAARFQEAKRELTFVSESEVRDELRREAGEASEGSLEEVWEATRARLAEKVFRAEVEQWLERQESLGRVIRNPLPER